jgi:deferrochelatase/peroxidase EfeB
MFIGNPPGNYDRLLDFSTAKTGSLFFVPTMDMLDDFPLEMKKRHQLKIIRKPGYRTAKK